MTDTSQNGEATIVASCFHKDHKGLVVEIGSWEPIEKSNSRLFIYSGWDAILVEFSPVPVEKLVREYGYNDRVRIIQAAVTPNERHVERFHITEDALSTDSEAQVEKWRNMRTASPLTFQEAYHGGFYGALWVPTLSWDALKNQFFPERVPDFISVDTEGHSAELAITILKSDWRPKFLCAEHDNRDTEIMQVAIRHGYVAIERNQENLILRCDKWGNL